MSESRRVVTMIDRADGFAGLDPGVVHAVVVRLVERGWSPPTDLVRLAEVIGADPVTMTVTELGEAVVRWLTQDLNVPGVQPTSA